MKPIDPAEISALLDGELMPKRAAEVRRAIAGDQSLRQIHDRMALVDADLRDYSANLSFEPRVVLPAATSGDGVRIFLVALAFVMLRLATKLMTPALATGLMVVVLVGVAVWVLRRLIKASDDDRLRLASEMVASLGLTAQH